jgi:putative YhbY family RNA-binding protein
MDPLLPAFRRELRARAHHLHPVVAIGQHGLTAGVLAEIGVALAAHELIKLRVFSDERAARNALRLKICAALDCACVQQIGKLLVLWRPRPSEAAPLAGRVPARMRNDAGSKLARSKLAGSKRAGSKLTRATAAELTRASTVTRRRPPAGKAPAGVPRAASPRRRRRVG